MVEKRERERSDWAYSSIHGLSGVHTDHSATISLIQSLVHSRARVLTHMFYRVLHTEHRLNVHFTQKQYHAERYFIGPSNENSPRMSERASEQRTGGKKN